MVPTSPSATTLNRFVPLATCSDRPRDSSAGSVTAEPLLARVLMKPPSRPAKAARSASNHPTKAVPSAGQTASAPTQGVDRRAHPFFDGLLCAGLSDPPAPDRCEAYLAAEPGSEP